MQAIQSTKGTYAPVDGNLSDSERGLKFEPYTSQYGEHNVLVSSKRKAVWSWRKFLIFSGCALLLLLVYGAGLLTMFLVKRGAQSENTHSNVQPLNLDKQKFHNLENQKPQKFTNSSTKAASQPQIVLPSTRGTNENNEFVGPARPGANLLGVDYDAVAFDPKSQPVLPVRTDGCAFVNTPQLGFDGSTPLGVFRNSYDRPIERSDVIQGNIGDCGFGAALLALIGNGQHLELQQAMVKFDKFLTVRFRVPKNEPLFKGAAPTRFFEAVPVRIDDVLPMKSAGSAATCPSYIGFYPSSTPAKNLYVPLLEKAWAKYVDATPSNQNSPNDKGYRGLTATRSSKVLQALTGKDGHIVTRRQKGFDQKLALQIFRCILTRLPCVVLTGNPNMKDIGDVGKDGVLRSEAGDMGAGAEGKTFTIIERTVPRKVFTFVGTHYYAIDNEATGPIDTKKYNNIFDHEVVLRNPWNCNPIVSSGINCVDGKDGELRVRLSTLFYGMVQVEWAENL